MAASFPRSYSLLNPIRGLSKLKCSGLRLGFLHHIVRTWFVKLEPNCHLGFIDGRYPGFVDGRHLGFINGRHMFEKGVVSSIV